MIRSFKPVSPFVRVAWLALPLSTVLGACGADPAFTEKTVEFQKSTPDEDSSLVASNSAESNAGEKLNPQVEVNTDGTPIALPPGVNPNLVVDTKDDGGLKTDGLLGNLDPKPTPTPTPPLAPIAKAGSRVNHATTQAKGKVDILWAIDSSGSMAWAQKQLGAKFGSFASKLNEANVDFQLGVTTLDVCAIDWSTGKAKANEHCPEEDIIAAGTWINNLMVGPAQGRLIPDPQTNVSVLKPGLDFVQSFVRTAKVGTSGSGNEHGLTAARMAIEKGLADPSKGFLRKDAFLSVIILSDEEDDGVQFWCEDAYGNTSRTSTGEKDLSKCKKGGDSPYLDAFGSIPLAITTNPDTGKNYTDFKYTASNFKSFVDKPEVKGPGKVRVSAITGLKDKDGKVICNSDDIGGESGPKEAGTNYSAAAQLTGGQVENICSKNWDKVLENVGTNVGQLANQIALPTGKIPFPGTLEVAINGVKLESAKYSYNSNGNYLIFNVVPPSGASITVTYLETVY